VPEDVLETAMRRVGDLASRIVSQAREAPLHVR
jgi:hypothetical protein